MLDVPSTFRPDRAADVVAIVAEAARHRRPIEIVGHASRRGVGHPVRSRQVLDLSALSGIVSYEPDELVLTAKAGTPLAEIEQLLAAENQELAFEPIHHGELCGQISGRGTLGGAMASNASGPRRLKAGAARDHVLGVHAVSGRGEAFKSGGRVVKNVTGYDLSKGLAGSWGMLAVMTEISVKVLPRAETSATIALIGLDDAEGVAALCAAMGSAAEISAAAHVPAAASGLLPLPALHGVSCTLMRLEGFEPSVAYRADRLMQLFSAREMLRLAEDASVSLWKCMRAVRPLSDVSLPLWRLSVTPTRAPAIAKALTQQFGCRYMFDWSGGLIWVQPTHGAADGEATAIRAAIRAHGGGHATLVRSAGVADEVPRFEPQEAALSALSRRLREGFDPLGILNPGRMG